MNLLNKKVTVIGLGVTGEACIKYLLKRGAKLSVRDKKNTPELKEKIEKLSGGQDIEIILGDKYLSGLLNDQDTTKSQYDFVVLTPGINPHQPEIERLKKAGIPIHNDITLFLEEWGHRGTTIGVTGSNGKSTVVTIMRDLLIANKLPVRLGGNIGVSPLCWLDENIDSNTTIVLEVSSYLLEQFTDKYFFDIFILTNISENHLDRYPLGIDEYTKTKLQGIKKDHTLFITSVDDEDLYKKVLAWSECEKVLPISLHDNINGERGVLLTKNGVVISKESTDKNITLLSNISDRKVLGEHNAYDIIYALSALLSFPLVLSVNDEVIRKFKGLPHRTEFIAKINGVTYINDSKSTTPDATKKALSSATNKNIILIAGGEDKGTSFESLKKDFERFVKVLILLPGEGSGKIKEVARGVVSDIRHVASMSEAFTAIKNISKHGDTVLLSPAAASRNIFKNFEDRGEQFVAEISKLTDSK